LLKLDFRDVDPEIIDLSTEGGLVETLKECKVECLMPEKVRMTAIAPTPTY
jgi:ATP-dependent RNA helicase DDX24/MAK5